MRTKGLFGNSSGRPADPQPTNAQTGPERGFTLVEVLVALVASGLLLAIVMNGALLARDRGARAAEAREAVLVARHLAAVGAARAYAPGTSSGRQGRLAWTLSEQPLVSDPRGLWVLAGIEVTVESENGARLFAGGTRRLKRAVEP